MFSTTVGDLYYNWSIKEAHIDPYVLLTNDNPVGKIQSQVPLIPSCNGFISIIFSCWNVC